LNLPDWDSLTPNNKKDLDTAFKITVNKIIEWKQIPRNKNYEIAMNDINSWNIESKFYALKYINSLVQVTWWSSWRKNIKDFKQIKERHNLTKKEYLEFKIEQIKKQIKESNNDTEKFKLELELENLKENIKEDDFKWEVFTWWEEDKQSESWEKEQQV
jgi:hypothetical protein